MRCVEVEVHLKPEDIRGQLEADVRRGFADSPKWLPPVWFYDQRGSELFEKITDLDEYYPTRAERALLERHSHDIAERSGAETLVELGAGACEKTRLLLDGLHEGGSLRRYVPFDVSVTTADAAERLARDYPTVNFQTVIGDFRQHLDRLPMGGRSLIAFLGGTVGNLPPEQRAEFLFDIAVSMDAQGHLLLGTDLVKDRARLLAAYDDSEGITAAFNRNVLAVLNRELGANFEPEGFTHVALWNEEEQWIEMRLRARQAVIVDISALGLRVGFEASEDLQTEISAKFTPDRVDQELSKAGFVVDEMWGAGEGEFLLTLAHPVG